MLLDFGYTERAELYKDSEEQIWAHLHRGVRLRPGGHLKEDDLVS